MAEDRRSAERIRLSESLVARFGTEGVVLVDVSEVGAKIEHYHRVKVGDEKIFRLRVRDLAVAINASVVVSKVHRFASGDAGLTVYRTGLRFMTATEADLETVKQMISSARAQTLVEQVANAKGFVPPRGEMPIFRGGVLTSNQVRITSEKRDAHLLPDRPIVKEIGYIRFYKRVGRWMKIWTMDPAQPEDGFTVSANEPVDQVDQLCDLYRNGDESTRELVRLLASTSLEDAAAGKDP
jgi:hypothetical protein